MSGQISLPEHWPPRILIGTSGLLGLEILAGVAVRYARDAPSTQATLLGLGNTFLIGVLTSVPFLLVLGYAGIWLSGSDIDLSRHQRILFWFLGGGLVFFLVNIPLMALFSMSLLAYVAWVRWALSIGMAVGTWIGITEARTIENTLAHEREKIRADQLEAQRDLFEYLNSLLRHEVLNTANTIDGYASLLLKAHDSDAEEHQYAEVISRQSRGLETIIEDVRSLLEILHGTAEFEPIDLGELLHTEKRLLESTYADAEIDVDVPDGTIVYGDSLLRRLFGNLIRNGIEHCDRDGAKIEVSGVRTEDGVVITVADNGPGIPEEVQNTLFERPRKSQVNHGLGLYLVGRLTEYYGGTIELVETGGDGTVFRVDLPTADVDADRSDSKLPTPSGFGLRRETR